MLSIIVLHNCYIERRRKVTTEDKKFYAHKTWYKCDNPRDTENYFEISENW